MPLRFCHAGDFHLDEDRYFADTAHCLEWFVADAIRASVDLFVINGDLTTYKATIKERNFWVDRLVEMANHAPVILVAGNHGAELEGDLYVFGRAKGNLPIYLCTEPQFLELGKVAVAIFPYPRKAEMAGNAHSLGEAFARQLDEFDRRFEQHPGSYKLFFGHFGVAGARVSSGQPLVGRCAEYPLDPLRSLKAQYVGLSHVHLRQQLAPRVWYAGSLSRCDYSEVAKKTLTVATRCQQKRALHYLPESPKERIMGAMAIGIMNFHGGKHGSTKTPTRLSGHPPDVRCARGETAYGVPAVPCLVS